MDYARRSLLLPVLLYTTNLVRVRYPDVCRCVDEEDIEQSLLWMLAPVAIQLFVHYWFWAAQVFPTVAKFYLSSYSRCGASQIILLHFPAKACCVQRQAKIT